VLSALLRVAEGLDRSHSQPLRALRLRDRGEQYVAALQARGDAELELWAAARHVAPLEGILEKPVRFELAERRRQPPRSGGAGRGARSVTARAGRAVTRSGATRQSR